MKNLRSAMFTLIVIGASAAAAVAGNHGKKDSTATKTCLEVLGMAVDSNNKPIEGATVTLYKENDEMEWTQVTSVMYHEHAFSFKLDVNQYYTIEISRPGYVTRSVGISTKIPSNVSLKDMFHYEFEVELFSEQKGMDDYYLDFPVALISYDKKRDVFDNNYAYTKHIKTKIQEAADVASGIRKKE